MRSFKISRRLIIFAFTSALALLALLGYARWAAAPVAAKVSLAGPVNLAASRFALPQDGLIGYWPFNGDGTDLSGGGRDVGLAGGVGFAGGLFGQALDLHNNGSQFAARPGDDAIYDFGASDFTIQVWVKFNNTSREQTLIEKFSGAGGPGWTLTKLDSNALHFYASPTVVLTSPSLPISSGVWHHILVRRIGILFQIIYDGSLVAAGFNGGSVPDTSMPLLIGKRNAFDGRNFAVDGRIDEAAIWSRALTNEEVVFLFNGGSGNPVVPANTAPVARCQNVTVSAGPSCTANASIDDGSSDPDGDSLTLMQSPPGPYLVGMTNVMLTVTDDKGGSSSCSATVTVVDDTKPAIMPLPIITRTNDPGLCSAVVPMPAPPPALFSDNCGIASITNNAPPGNVFPVGMTTVTWTVTDVNGNRSTAPQSVTVTDLEPPAITPPPNLTRASDPGLCSAVVFLPRPRVGDNCGGVSVSNNAPAGNIFPVGTTIVIWTATDVNGNSSTAQQTVTVTDNTPPVLTLTGQPIALWPPNHQYETISVAQLVASASDNCSGDLTASLVIAQVSSDEPEDALGGGDGNTLNDIVIAPDCKSVQLRAERQGSGNGRVYTLTFKVKDAAGNTATATAKVTVPKSQSNNGAALDDGPVYTKAGSCP